MFRGGRVGPPGPKMSVRKWRFPAATRRASCVRVWLRSKCMNGFWQRAFPVFCRTIRTGDMIRSNSKNKWGKNHVEHIISRVLIVRQKTGNARCQNPFIDLDRNHTRTHEARCVAAGNRQRHWNEWVIPHCHSMWPLQELVLRQIWWFSQNQFLSKPVAGKTENVQLRSKVYDVTTLRTRLGETNLKV